MNCIHLDFHTSPLIEGIGENFNKEEFTATVKAAKVDLMTVFAKCHHGYHYYPTKVGKMHPGLKFNLLKEEIDAIHAAGAKAPIYITVGWSKKDADEHPEWRHINFHTGKPIITTAVPKSPDDPLDHCHWETLCPVGDYKKVIADVTREVCESFDVSDGVFYDICFFADACACDSCKAGMKEMGLDPESYEDAKKYYVKKRIEFMKEMTALVQSYSKDAPVFYNGGANMNRTEYHPYQTHYELEDLPTAWGGYDLMPLRAKWFEKYGKHFLGMTGKFHHAWGEFGGFKNKEALRYECADMMSVGASISVGDHLHPEGKLDESTYRIIAHAFDYVNSIKDYCYHDGMKAYTDIGMWVSHHADSDIGLSKILQIMHLEYDVITSGESLKKYKCIILPDRVNLSDEDKARILKFANDGGKVIASYESVFDELGVKKIAPSTCDLDFIKCDIGDYTTPFLSYSAAYKTESDGEVIAEVYEPYFNRTINHFCGHKNTPNKPTAADYPALVKTGNLIYFAHPVFEAYNKSGNYVLENYIIKGIDMAYDRAVLTENLPSCARIRLRESEKDAFIALHLLYSVPVNRGIACLLSDFPTLHDVKITLKTDKNVTEIKTAPDDKQIGFEKKGDSVSFALEPFSLHKLVIIKYSE